MQRVLKSILTTLLLFSMILCVNIANAAIPELVYLKARAPVPAAGWWLPEAYGKDMAEGWSLAEKNARTWENAYRELRREVVESTAESRLHVEQVQKELEVERREWKKKVRRRTAQGVLWGLLLGGVSGAIIHNNL